jgi:prepilin-type N-terminal cleavage/methylation domain-containing protein
MHIKLRHINTGFSLIELIIVIFIISITLSLTIPYLFSSPSREIRSDARRFGNTLKYLYDRSVSRKKTYDLIIDFENDSWSYEIDGVTKTFRLSDGVFFKDVSMPSTGTVNFGRLKISFGPMGATEPMLIHLTGGDKELTVSFNNLNGRVRYYEGYRL